MRLGWGFAAAGALALLGSARGQCRAAPADPAQTVTAQWPEPSRLAAAQLSERYGPADQIEADRLRWVGRAPWKRITLWMVPLDSSAGGLDETVALRVAPEQVRELRRFSPQLRVSELGTELSARSDSEEVNRLLLNLAYRIVQGRLDPAAARKSFAKELRLRAAGKESPLMGDLLFRPAPAAGSAWPVRLDLGPEVLPRRPLWRSRPVP